jgi:hypothetical protein
MRKAITALALIALVGCATTPTPVKTAEQVSSDSIYGFQEKTAEDAGKITVIRDGGFTGSGCDLIFYIEGKRAAKIGTGQKASFYVQPGDINLGLGPIFSAACGSAAIRTISAKVRPNQESLFRLSGDMQGFYLAPYIDYGGK